MNGLVLEKLFAIKDITIVFILVQFIFMTQLFIPRFWFVMKDIKFSQKFENYNYEHDYIKMKKSGKRGMLFTSAIYLLLVLLALFEVK